MSERWAVIHDFPNYEVSDLGRVRRLAADNSGRGRAGDVLVSRRRSGSPYPSVSLTLLGVQKIAAVRCLVARAFLGPMPDGMEIAHGNHNTRDSRAINLTYRPIQEDNSASVTGIDIRTVRHFDAVKGILEKGLRKTQFGSDGRGRESVFGRGRPCAYRFVR